MEATEKQRQPMTNMPLGMSLLQGCLFSSPWSRKKKLFLRATVFILTFLCYMSYHLSRKPPSIVKSVLHNTDKETNDDDHSSSASASASSSSALLTSNGGWAPFDDERKGEGMLGSLDTAFLASYAVGMFFSGHLGDRVNLRYFLSAGMILTGICTTLFGMAYLWNIHSFWYFVVVQVLSGLFQSTGWPSVVSIMGNWFGKGRRGFVMGVWNANTSVGNILGALVASAALGLGWGYSFILPGIIIGVLGVIVFFFLVVAPPPPASAANDEAKAVEEGSINQDEKLEGGDENEEEIYLLENSKHQAEREEKKQEKGINFFKAWLIPGVAEFALALFFCKLVSYTFLYWLPFYLKHTEIGGKRLGTSEAGNLSTLFDVGGILGGILAGLLSDTLRGESQATTSALMMYLAIPALYLYRLLGDRSFALNILLMFMGGLFVNGPYSLITTAVSADLGTHSCLKGDAKALATVTAIIDGTGSVGAAVGPFITGWLSNAEDGWDRVFWMLMGMCGASALLLSRLVWKELRKKARLCCRRD